MNQISYIYALIDPRNEEVRYIGQSITPYERYTRHIWNAHNINNNYHVSNFILLLHDGGLKPKLKILEECIADKSDEREQYWISYHKLAGCRLTNMTEGGQIHRHNDEIKKKLSEVGSEPVEQYDMEGNYIREFKSAKEAGEILGISNEKISAAISGSRKSSGGYQWKKKHSNKEIKPYKSYSDISAAKKIYQYTIDGNYVREWESVAEAARCISISESTIISVASGKGKTAKGYQWRYTKYNKIEKATPLTNGKPKQIIQYSLDGKPLRIFDSLTEVERNLNGIKRKTLKRKCDRNLIYFGYKWSYQANESKKN